MKLSVILFLMLAMFRFPAFSQNKARYRNLVMEGGGIRGVAYGGALAELEKQGILPNIKRVGGTSAGAIQALLLAVGYTPEEITRITYNTQIKKFADGRFIFFGGFNRMSKQFGWYRGEKFSKWLGNLIEQKTGNSELTFSQLHALAGKNNCRDLYVTGTNLTRQQAVTFSFETYPNMKLRDAVRISMSIPLFFQAVAIDSTGKVFPLNKKKSNLEIMVDGGILVNFPIRIFDDIHFTTGSYQSSEKTQFINPETIGLRLDRDEQITYDKKQNGLAPYPIHNFSDYMGAFYNIVLENLNRSTLKPEDWSRTISINTLQFSPKIRKMSVTEKEQLLESGRQAVRDFFKSN